MQPHAYLFDALLVLNQQLHTWDVNVEPWSLRRALNWSVYTAIVLAACAHMEMTHTVRLGSLPRYNKTMRLTYVNYYWLLPDKHLSEALSIYKTTIS